MQYLLLFLACVTGYLIGAAVNKTQFDKEIDRLVEELRRKVGETRARTKSDPGEANLIS